MKNPFEHGGNLYAAIRQKGGSITDLLDFSANINPLGMPEKVRQSVIAALDDVIHYPDSEAAELKAAIVSRYKVDQQYIAVGNGAAELVYLLCHILKPKRVLIPAPTFSEYERAARAAGSEIEYMYLSADCEFIIDPAEVIKQIPNVDIIFLCNPNNPTGKILSRDHLETIIAAASSRGVHVMVDESFLDFIAQGETYTCRPLLEKYQNLIILQSLTKFYAIPGLRLGFMLGTPTIVAMLDKGKDPWNVNLLAQVAGAQALADEKYQNDTIATIEAARNELFTGLASIPGLRPLSGAANFLLVDISGTGRTAQELRQACLVHNILIRDCSNFPGLSSDYIRVAVKLPQQNKLLLETLSKTIKGSD